jgi:hypothetical protein
MYAVALLRARRQRPRRRAEPRNELPPSCIGKLHKVVIVAVMRNASGANVGAGGAEAVATHATDLTGAREDRAHAVAAFTAHMEASSTVV